VKAYDRVVFTCHSLGGSVAAVVFLVSGCWCRIDAVRSDFGHLVMFGVLPRVGDVSFVTEFCRQHSDRFVHFMLPDPGRCPSWSPSSRPSPNRTSCATANHTPRGEEYVNIELSPVRDASGEIAWFIEKMEPMHVARGVSDHRGLIGRSPAFQRMLELIARVAPSDASVLLQGESGTGKELLASAVHEASRRAEGPFVVVDCSGLPETLFESEVFGHERGAFTGATARKPGLVEAASGGTLFLDEVGDIPLAMQVKLLRLLETGTYRRVGSTELRRADIRLVSATHRPLKRMIAEGGFRQDLYFRINTFPITVPPLREREGDLPLLIDSLLRARRAQAQA
jgi:two-component system response regulator HydG